MARARAAGIGPDAGRARGTRALRYPRLPQVGFSVAIVLVVAEVFSQRSLKLKINAGLVLIPLVLRALMIR